MDTQTALNQLRSAVDRCRVDDIDTPEINAALDFLEAPQDLKTERYGSPSVLYTQLLVGVLMRTLTGYMKLPKSRARAEALGIAVSNDFVPAQERKLERKPSNVYQPQGGITISATLRSVDVTLFILILRRGTCQRIVAKQFL